ncbi:hypothetical protein [Sutcliffiella horikoshii]|uniref:hypothetical protein n=1 Tax=Sutcliffiella horikoshii TaxID=79883 RepID=UPI003CEE60A6
MGYFRSDHLLAVLQYALEQAETSGIEVLDFGDNENVLDYKEQVEEINSMIKQVEQLTLKGHTSLSIIERDSLASLLLDSMSLNFSQDSSLDEIRTYFLNKHGMDDELIQEVYDDFKKTK